MWTNLDDKLDKWGVMHPGEQVSGPDGWWAVFNDDDGIIAYFAREIDAYRWRMSMINRELNP